MKPQKKSIRDFFSPAPSSRQQSLGVAPQSSGSSSECTSSLRASKKSETTLESHTALPSRTAHSETNHTSTSVSASPVTGISATTQPPTASQTSANSGASKRTVSNGQDVVLNSDSDSESLPDLDWGPLKTSLKSSATTATRSKRTIDDEEDGLRKPPKKGRNKKFDILAETAQKNMELEQKILNHKAELETATQESRSAQVSFDENTLAQAVDDDDDPDKAHRLLLAMQRTNATQTEHVFHFFEDTLISTAIDSKFPFHSLPKHRWASSFRDPFIRDQTFLTGTAYQIFRLQQLPQELASWMIDQVCATQNELLSLKYMDILDLHHDYLRTLLDRNRLDAIVSSLGGGVNGLNMGSGVSRSFDALANTAHPLPRPLGSVIKLLQRATPWLRSKARSHVLHILCYICMDDRVLADANILQVVKGALEAAVCSFADQDELNIGLYDVMPRLISCITDPVLQRNLVASLPAQSPLTAYLQRYLAFSFLMDSTMLEGALSDPRIPANVHKYLDESPHFRINKETQYDALAARLNLLDIAIGPGLLSVPYRPLLSPPISQAASSPLIKPTPSSSEIKYFNAEVDALAQHIKILGNSIVEASASVDLTILEAKDCVERLSARLEHAVRVGGKRAHHVFGNEEEDKQLKVTDIFQRAAKARQVAKGSGIFGDDESDGTDDAAAQIQAECRRVS